MSKPALNLGWFETARATVQEAIDAKDNVTCADLHKTLDMGFDEHATAHKHISLACTSGVMSTALGCKLNAILGGTVSVFNRALLADKILVTNIFKALLQAHIAGPRR